MSQCPSLWGRYRCGLEDGHSGSHEHFARWWNDGASQQAPNMDDFRHALGLAWEALAREADRAEIARKSTPEASIRQTCLTLGLLGLYLHLAMAVSALRTVQQIESKCWCGWTGPCGCGRACGDAAGDLFPFWGALGTVWGES